MTTSGATAKATSSDDAVVLLTAIDHDHSEVTILNESGVAGFYSLDGGVTWARWLDGAKSKTMRARIDQNLVNPVQFKRVAGGADVTGLWAESIGVDRA